MKVIYIKNEIKNVKIEMKNYNRFRERNWK